MKSIFSFIKKNSRIFFISLLISLSIGFFTPSLIYLTNQLEFSYLYIEILPELFFVTFLLFSFFFIILFLTKKFKNRVINKKIASLLFSTGVLIWFQSNILNWNYGLFNGELIDWSSITYRYYIDGIIWFIFLSLSIIKYKYIYKQIKKFSIFLILIQILYCAILIIKTGSPPIVKKYEINEDKKFIFSKEKNVIILLLDGAQTNIFFDILNEQPHNESMLNGFNYFPDTLSSYSATDFSIPSFLSGKEYLNDTVQQNFLKKSFGENEFLRILKQYKFTTEMYSDMLPSMYLYANKFVDNIKEKKYTIFNPSMIKEVSYLYDITLFKSTPSLLKKYIYNNQKWRLSNLNINLSNKKKSLDGHYEMVRFINEFQRSIFPNDNHPAFKYYHLSGAHPPYVLNADMSIGTAGYDINAYKNQMRGLMILISKFLSTIKKAGLFDDSFIVILGDHGLGFPRTEEQKNFEGNSQYINYIDSKTVGKAIPLLLIKPFNSSDKFKLRETPASLMDIPKTIIKGLNINESNISGIDLLNVNNDSIDRLRFHYSFNWTKKEIGKDYPQYLNKYLINGNSWEKESWDPFLIKYLPEGKIEKRTFNYEFGERILFTESGNSDKYKLGGWSDPEIAGTWTDENVSTLNLKLTSVPNNNTELHIFCTPFSPQQVYIYMNNILVDQFTLSKEGEYLFKINNDILKIGENYLSFVLPNANKSPFDLGNGNDIRKLGLLVKYLYLK